MRKLYAWIVNHRKTILALFLAMAAAGLLLKNFVAVNYDMNDYLPEDTHSTVSLDIMQEEFDGGIPNARVMVRDVTIPEALEYKAKIETVNGVTAVTWLDDAVDITVPLTFFETDTIETYYKENTALFSVTIEEESRISAVEDIREIIGDENAMTGSAVSTAAATVNTVSEIQKIAIIAVLFVLFVLLMTTNSWLEPLVILAGLGVAILINSGSNLIFGEISFVTNAAGSILQLAVSLDYSVFLIHRFEECRAMEQNEKEAMVEALCKSTSSILSSGLTTVIGFLALVLMQFGIGPDLGLALAKGVAISLITVFVFMPALVLSVYKLLDKTRHKRLLPDFKGFGKAVRRIAIPMVCVFAVLVVPVYLASNSNEYYYGASKIFSEKTQTGADTAAIEAVYGENDTYVLMVPRDDLATQTALSDELHTLPQITSIISYVDMAGAEIPMEYLDEDTLSQLISENYSRMVLSVKVGYEGEETFELVEQIRSIAESYYPGSYYLAGEGVSTYDLMQTVTADMVKVNLVAIAAVFLVLFITLKSISLPVILVLSIETAIWINLAVPYFTGSTVFYIAYLIISSIQLGATVDYAILMTDRYKENRQTLEKKDAVVETISDVTVSILTSGIVLTVVGLLLGYVSSNQLLAQLGIFIGRGAIFSLIIVLFVLPGLLYLFDWLVIRKKKGMVHMGKSHQILSIILAAALLLSLLPISAYAAEPNTPKEEVVYVNLNTNGSIEEINVVNIFELDEDGQIIDYGCYESLRNMTTTDEIDYSEDTVTIDAKAGKLYYEGRLDGSVMPWDVSIHYYMDGKEYTAEEIAGRSGALKIAVSITENVKCQGDFFEGYALQASLTLDTKKCHNIVAEDATIANVGSDKQLTYTILPGKGADFVITADVSDFEMDGISINGIPLNLNMEIEDDELMEQVTELIDAIEQLDDGVLEFQDGVSDLQNGVQTDLQGGVLDLQDGAAKLYDGTAELKDGGSNLYSGASELQNGAATLDEGIQSLDQGVAHMQAALNALNQQSPVLAEGSAAFKSALGQLQAALDGVTVTSEDLSALQDASAAIKTGIDDLVNGVTALQQGVSFEAYESAMAANGLDMESLQQNNAAAISSLQAMIGELNNQLAVMQTNGEDTAALEGQISELTNIIALLGADNASITGTKSYLTTVSQNLSALLGGATTLQTNYANFNTEIGKLVNTLGNLAYQMGTLSSAVDTLVSEYEKLDSGIIDYTNAVGQIVVSYAQISNGTKQLVSGSSALKTGTESLYGGTGELLSGIVEIYNGTGTLKDGTGSLDEGVAELLTALTQLYDGTGELKDGTSTMREETSGMDSKINDKIDDLLNSITGGDTEPSSFVSDKNENIKSVQFVIQTKGIQTAEAAETIEEEPENLNFLQKFLRLFGVYD